MCRYCYEERLLPWAVDLGLRWPTIMKDEDACLAVAQNIKQGRSLMWEGLACYQWHRSH